MVGTIAGVLLATVLNNGGGAWDNAKKYIESGDLKDDDGNVLGKGTEPTPRPSSATRSATRSRTPPARRCTCSSSCSPRSRWCSRRSSSGRDRRPRRVSTDIRRRGCPTDGRRPPGRAHRAPPGPDRVHPGQLIGASRARALDLRLGDRWADRQPGVRRLPAPGNARRAARLLRAGLDPLCRRLAGEHSRAAHRRRPRPSHRMAAHRRHHSRGPHRLRARGTHRGHLPCATTTPHASRSPASWWLGALALWLADRLGSQRGGSTTCATPTALAIGVAQALALFPGISRSGATITAGAPWG